MQLSPPHLSLPAAPPSLALLLRSPWLQEEGAPSSEAPLVFICCVLPPSVSSPSPSSGEAKRCVSISAEKRRRARADGGLESLSGNETSEHDSRFLGHMTHRGAGLTVSRTEV